MLKPVKKQPREVKPIILDWVNRLPPGSTISDVDVEVKNSSGDDLSNTIISGTPSYSGTKTTCYVQAGTDGQRLKVTFIVTFDDGTVLEQDIPLIIKEV